MTVTLIGLKNCDTCKKARKWLDAQGIDHAYVDVRADGISASDLDDWISAYGDWEPFLNRRGTTWRKLPDTDKDRVDQAKAIKLIVANPTLMKRPVVIMSDGKATRVTVGFDATAQEQISGFAG